MVALAPHFAAAEQRRNSSPWPVVPNENHDLLRAGAVKPGIPTSATSRKVNACVHSGSCGLACTSIAKQSMPVTAIPAAIKLGAQLLTETRAASAKSANNRVTAVIFLNFKINSAFVYKGRASIAIKKIAEYDVLTVHNINAPAVLPHAGAPDPHGRLGKSNFLHPSSCFPAFLTRRSRPGAAPQLSFFGAVNRLAQGLAKRLTGRSVPLVEWAA